MQYPQDAEAGKDVAAMMKHRAVVLDEAYSTVEFMSLMGCMDAVIANRLHALILHLSWKCRSRLFRMIPKSTVLSI